jgi:diadenylate cyclase
MKEVRWQDALDILIVSYIFYKLLSVVKGTRVERILLGIVVLLFLFFVGKSLELSSLNFVLGSFMNSLVIVIVIIFQNDIKKFLYSLGRNPFFKKISYPEETLFYDELTDACFGLAKRRLGALIVVEREINIDEFIEPGIPIDAQVNAELLWSIFQRTSPLHDGAVLIREGRIVAASCILPLTLRDDIEKDIGTRHRAALGISEVSDAIAIAVSEERGWVSYAIKGELMRNVTGEELKKVLKGLLE